MKNQHPVVIMLVDSTRRILGGTVVDCAHEGSNMVAAVDQIDIPVDLDGESSRVVIDVDGLRATGELKHLRLVAGSQTVLKLPADRVVVRLGSGKDVS